MVVPAFLAFRRFARDVRGAAAIELCIGSVALLGASTLGFDFYSLFKMHGASARSAVTMAEYVSREAAADGPQLTALGQFLTQEEFGSPADVVFVVSAVRRPPGGGAAEVLWTDDTIRFGAAGTTEALVGECGRRGVQGWRAALLGEPEASGMAEEEVAIVAEVCARPRREGILSSDFVFGDIYRLFIVRSRVTEQVPAAPEHPPSAQWMDPTIYCGRVGICTEAVDAATVSVSGRDATALFTTWKEAT